ncbi:hypothetical protein QR680_013102 [Steinernema hermaphroditum]|uniref:Uncharacterized protein n=1 Tax=Steinernema hermaphroditum TaxID=289476 RepID=A0AA39I5Z7_9BILA|nr:hypothetical protein QR680_013102 [Steinernema hermaphroditum]
MPRSALFCLLLLGAAILVATARPAEIAVEGVDDLLALAGSSKARSDFTDKRFGRWVLLQLCGLKTLFSGSGKRVSLNDLATGRMI